MSIALMSVLPILIDFATTAALLGRKPDKATRLWLWRSARIVGGFPAPVQLSPARVAWNRAAVVAWIESRPAVSYAISEEDRDAR